MHTSPLAPGFSRGTAELIHLRSSMHLMLHRRYSCHADSQRLIHEASHYAGGETARRSRSLSWLELLMKSFLNSPRSQTGNLKVWTACSLNFENHPEDGTPSEHVSAHESYLQHNRHLLDTMTCWCHTHVIFNIFSTCQPLQIHVFMTKLCRFQRCSRASMLLLHSDIEVHEHTEVRTKTVQHGRCDHSRSTWQWVDIVAQTQKWRPSTGWLRYSFKPLPFLC